jgi:hypothetical protein
MSPNVTKCPIGEHNIISVQFEITNYFNFYLKESQDVTVFALLGAKIINSKKLLIQEDS